VQTQCFTLVAHETDAVRLLGRELVVRAAAQSKIGHGCFAAACTLMYVIELQTLAGRAAMARFPDERASPAVPLPHLAPNGGGDVS
jgi:hypothetical protein